MKVLAIVIGNDDYPSPDKLKNAVTDAKAMEAVFVRLGYTIIPYYNFKKLDVPTILETIEKEIHMQGIRLDGRIDL